MALMSQIFMTSMILSSESSQFTDWPGRTLFLNAKCYTCHVLHYVLCDYTSSRGESNFSIQWPWLSLVYSRLKISCITKYLGSYEKETKIRMSRSMPFHQAYRRLVGAKVSKLGSFILSPTLPAGLSFSCLILPHSRKTLHDLSKICVEHARHVAKILFGTQAFIAVRLLQWARIWISVNQ